MISTFPDVPAYVPIFVYIHNTLSSSKLYVKFKGEKNKEREEEKRGKIKPTMQRRQDT